MSEYTIGMTVSVNQRGLKFIGEIIGEYTYPNTNDTEYVVTYPIDGWPLEVDDTTRSLYGVDEKIEGHTRAWYIDADDIVEVLDGNK